MLTLYQKLWKTLVGKYKKPTASLPFKELGPFLMCCYNWQQLTFTEFFLCVRYLVKHYIVLLCFKTSVWYVGYYFTLILQVRKFKLKEVKWFKIPLLVSIRVGMQTLVRDYALSQCTKNPPESLEPGMTYCTLCKIR